MFGMKWPRMTLDLRIGRKANVRPVARPVIGVLPREVEQEYIQLRADVETLMTFVQNGQIRLEVEDIDRI